MSRRSIRRAVKSFLSAHPMALPAEFESLCGAAEDLGYTVVLYSPYDPEPEVRTLISTLRISPQMLASRAFTYADRNYRMIFVQEGLNPGEKAVVLAHELGHIALRHMESAAVIGDDVMEEFSADAFARELTEPTGALRFRLFWRRKRRTILLCAAAGLLLAAGITAYLGSHQSVYYVTENGTKYHLADCISIAGRTVRKLTDAERRAGIYAPCRVCLPDKR